MVVYKLAPFYAEAVPSIPRTLWTAPAPSAHAYRRAGGRRRFNAERQLDAAIRRMRVAELWDELTARGGSVFDYGVRTRWAKRLGVHRSTITRDIDRILREMAAKDVVKDSSR